MPKIAFALALCFPLSIFATEPAPTCPERYHTPAKFLANPDESVLIAGVIGWCRNNKNRLLWDEGYAQVARLWSTRLVEDKIDPDRPIPMDRLAFELRAQGLTDATVIPFSINSKSEKLPEGLIHFLDQEGKKSRATHFAVGVARFPNQKQMVSTLLLGRRPAIIDPMPVCPLPGNRLPVRLRLLRSYRHPHWLMITPEGQVIKDAFLYEEGAWHGEVPLDAGAGEYRLEIMVLGPQGPEIAALFPLYAGVPRPLLPQTKIHPAPGRYRSPDDAEAAMLALTNQARSRVGLPAIALDQKLSDLAREHAMSLLMARHASHRSKRSGTLADRLRKAGVVFARAMENVSLTSSPETAHEGFMESPGHRLNIIDASATKIGIGIAMEREANRDIMAICEVFIEGAQAQQSTKMVAQIAKLINDRRRKKGRFNLGLNKSLSQEAMQSARRLAGLGDRANPQAEADATIAKLLDTNAAPKSVRVRFFRTINPARVLSAPECLDEDINHLGIGVASARSSVPGELWIAVIFAGQ